MSEFNGEVDLHFDADIHSFHSNGLTLASKSLLYRGTVIDVKSEEILNIFGRKNIKLIVRNCRYSDRDHLYHIKMNFLSLDERCISAYRGWLVLEDSDV